MTDLRVKTQNPDARKPMLRQDTRNFLKYKSRSSSCPPLRPSCVDCQLSKNDTLMSFTTAAVWNWLNVPNTQATKPTGFKRVAGNSSINIEFKDLIVKYPQEMAAFQLKNAVTGMAALPNKSSYKTELVCMRRYRNMAFSSSRKVSLVFSHDAYELGRGRGSIAI